MFVPPSVPRELLLSKSLTPPVCPPLTWWVFEEPMKFEAGGMAAIDEGGTVVVVPCWDAQSLSPVTLLITLACPREGYFVCEMVGARFIETPKDFSDVMSNAC